MFAKLFSIRPANDSITTPTARANLVTQVPHNPKKAFIRTSTNEKTVPCQEDQIVQHAQTTIQQVQTPQAHRYSQAEAIPSRRIDVTGVPSSPPPTWTEDQDDLDPSTSIKPPPLISPATTTSPLTPPLATTPLTATVCPPTSLRSFQVAADLAAARKRVAELEALINLSKLKHAKYVKKIEAMELAGCIQARTYERDVFRSRVKPAEQEMARKKAEKSKMEEDCRKERERKLQTQLLVLGAKRAIEDSAKEYAQLDVKFLELQGRSIPLHYEADQKAHGGQGSGADGCEH